MISIHRVSDIVVTEVGSIESGPDTSNWLSLSITTEEGTKVDVTLYFRNASDAYTKIKRINDLVEAADAGPTTEEIIGTDPYGSKQEAE